MKLYVTNGKQSILINGGNPIHGCILALRRFLKESECETELSTIFRVSQRGFEEHDDDVVVSLGQVIALNHLANNGVVEHCKVIDACFDDYGD